jgi:hypothetical protein
MAQGWFVTCVASKGGFGDHAGMFCVFLDAQSLEPGLNSCRTPSGEWVCLLEGLRRLVHTLDQRSTALLCNVAEPLVPSLHGCLNTAADGECLARRPVCAI